MSQDYNKELFLSGFAMGYSTHIENKDDAKLIREAGEALLNLIEKNNFSKEKPMIYRNLTDDTPVEFLFEAYSEDCGEGYCIYVLDNNRMIMRANTFYTNYKRI